MCGIAAIFAYDSSAPGVNEGELVSIRDCMAPRGPDGAGLWFDPTRRVGLGHRRLSIIDVSTAGAQPMLLPEKHLVITFNGEIYNYRELRATLEQKGHQFRSTSDTEVLLRLYAEEGEAMLNKLRGMFAFAIWDGVKQTLFVARDPFGIKPLYCADDGKTLRVASQVKALLVGGKIDTSPEPAGHVGFFLWGHVPEPYTFYRGIRALPAGSSLSIGGNGKKRLHTFCDIPGIFSEAEQSGSQISTPNSQPACEHLHSALADTVRHHLIADVPVGVFLSSGLDSTTLAALAAEQGGTLRTVTLGFEEYRNTVNDETPLAEIIARQYGAQHQTVWINRDDFRKHVGKLFAAMDMPTIDGANTYFVSLAAKRAALKVALSGLGGDEIFGGYPSFAEIPRSVKALGWLGAPSVIGRIARLVSAPILKHMTSPKYAGLLEYGGSYSGAYLLRRGLFMPWELPDILDGDMVRQGWTELQTLVRLDETIAGLNSSRAKVSALEMCWYMRHQLLRDSDWAGMAHSLEIRVPLVDVALLRSLASALVSARPPTKRDMADAPTKKLSAEILNRPKTGFRIPVREWLMTENSKSTGRGLRGWAQQVHSHFTRN